MAVKLNFENDILTADVDLSAELNAAAEAVCKRAKELCPVDTGRLQASISVSQDGNGAYVSAGTDYAPYVEFGTSKAAAQPFLVPALLSVSAELADIISGGGE